MILKTMTPNIQARMEETILAFTPDKLKQDLLRAMCQTIYLDGFERAMKLIEMVVDGRISKQEFDKLAKQP